MFKTCEMKIVTHNSLARIDLLDILQNSRDPELFLDIFIRDVRSSGVRASITIVHIRNFYKVNQKIVRFRFFLRIANSSIAKRSIGPLVETF